MTTVAVIPARYAATRLPAKPLLKETGKYLVQHVYEAVAQSRKIDRVVVATDDRRIVEAVRSFGGEALLTRPDHNSGTDRVAEVAAGLEFTGDDLVLNVQGDEPEIHPDCLNRLVEQMQLAVDSALESRSTGCDPGTPGSRQQSSETRNAERGIGISQARHQRPRIGTIAARFADEGPKSGPGSPLDPNCVKVVLDAGGRALYFSRSLIPYPRATKGIVDRPSRWWQHLGVYAFRADTLRTITSADRKVRSEIEEAESLEQLRWLEQGFAILVVPVEHGTLGIDTPEDYAAFVRRVSKNQV